MSALPIPVPASLVCDQRAPIEAARIIAGTPLAFYRTVFEAAGAEVGLWECSEGAWRVAYGEDEICHLLSGRVRVTSDDGATFAFDAGESFVIPRGFHGVWEVFEPVRKLYVILRNS